MKIIVYIRKKIPLLLTVLRYLKQVNGKPVIQKQTKRLYYLEIEISNIKNVFKLLKYLRKNCIVHWMGDKDIMYVEDFRYYGM